MTILDSIQLGTATNLVRGYHRNWDPGLRPLNPLRPISDTPFKKQAPAAIEPTGISAYPEVALHGNIIKTRQAKARLQQSKSLTANLSSWLLEVAELLQVRPGS